ncbi:MAG TPA: hypothetical protein VE961_06475, partial [Pyrinomonadaceae bacterium]|nr:hypothetical protein [Pyrinomonadaceae bacterium]
MDPRRGVSRRTVRTIILIACIAGLSTAVLIGSRPAAASVTINAGTIFQVLVNGPENVSVDCSPAPGSQVRVTIDGATTVTSTVCGTVTSLTITATGQFDNTISIANVNSANFPLLIATNLAGGPGNDVLIGSPLNDNLDGGPGDDTFIGNGGTDLIGGGSGSSVGDSILVSGTSGDDTINLSTDATGHLLATVNGATTTYEDFLGGPVSTSGIEHIIVQGLAGKDTLTVDSTNGPVPIPINYDGGDDQDSLVLTGGTATADTYTPGPSVEAGVSELVIGGVTQTVSFTNIEPVSDLVAGPLTVNGTNANNAINYTQGPGGGIFVGNTGLVTVDNLESCEFNNKTDLVINGLAGDDTINLDNTTTPAGLTGIITVNGGDPTASDTLIVNGQVNAADAFTYLPSIPTSDSGSVSDTGLPQVNFATIEHLVINGRNLGPGGGADSLTINTTNLSAGETEILTPGSQFDSGHVDFRDRPGGFNPLAVPVDFTKLGVGSSVTFTDSGRFDSLIYNGTPLNDTFSVTATGTVGLNTQIPVNTPSITNLILAGLDGDDTFNVAGNHNLGGVIVQGGNPSASDVLNFNGNGAAAVNTTLPAQTVAEAGFNNVTFSGVEVINVNAAGAADKLNDSVAADSLTFTPTAANAATLTASSSSTIFNFSNVSTAAGGFSIGATGSGDQLFVKGTQGADTIDVNDGASGANAVKVNGLLTVNYNPSLTHVELDSLAGSDSINAAPSTGTAFTVDGGDPTASPGDTINLIHPAAQYAVFPGPTSDSGAMSTSGFQNISWSHIESVLGTSGGGVPIITGTDADDQITVIARDSSYNPASPGVPNPLLDGVQDFTVSVNGGPEMLFVNQPFLFIDGMAGNDDVVVRGPAPNQAVWNVQVYVAGGPPAVGENGPGDKIRLETPGTQTVTYNPNNSLSSVPAVPGVVFATPVTGAGQFVDATNNSTVNAVQYLVPLFYQSSPGGVERFEYAGESGNDTLSYNSPNNADAGSSLVYTPGATADAGAITGNQVGGPALTPLSFSNLGSSSTIAFTTSNAAGRTDQLTYNGTSLNDTFTVSNTGQVNLNNQIPVTTSSILTLTLAGLGGDDIFNTPGDHNFPGMAGGPGIVIQGGDPAFGKVNYSAPANVLTTADLRVGTISSAGFAAVGFSGVGTVNEQSTGINSRLTIQGANGPQNVVYSPTGAVPPGRGAGTVSGSGPTFNFAGVGRPTTFVGHDPGVTDTVTARSNGGNLVVTPVGPNA